MIKTLNVLVLALSSWALPVAAADVPASAASRAASTSPADSGKTHAHAQWKGLWIGVEGLFVDIALAGPGAYTLEMMGETDAAKDNIRIPGRDAKGGISFERDGKTMLLRAATGEQTGLKWLEDKKNCLMVEEFEGFCRD